MSVISKRGHSEMGLQSKRSLTGILLVQPVKYYTFLDKIGSSCISLRFCFSLRYHGGRHALESPGLDIKHRPPGLTGDGFEGNFIQ
jgi:hypothetical protein